MQTDADGDPEYALWIDKLQEIVPRFNNDIDAMLADLTKSTPGIKHEVTGSCCTGLTPHPLPTVDRRPPNTRGQCHRQGEELRRR